MGSKTETTTAVQEPPPEFKSAYLDLLNAGRSLSQQPLQQYGGPTVAGLTPQQERGFQQISKAAGIAEPFLNTASKFATKGGGQSLAPAEFSASAVQPYLNPYIDEVVNATQAHFNRENEIAQNRLKGDALGVGAWGGSRSGVAQAELQKEQDLVQNPIIAGMYADAFNQAVNQWGRQQGLGLTAQMAEAENALRAAGILPAIGETAQGTTLKGAQAEAAAGEQARQIGQQQINADVQQFQQAQQYPYDILNFLSGLTTGVGALSGGTSTTTQPGPNPVSQVAGLALAAAPYLKSGGRARRQAGGAIDLSTSFIPEFGSTSMRSTIPGAPNGKERETPFMDILGSEAFARAMEPSEADKAKENLEQDLASRDMYSDMDAAEEKGFLSTMADVLGVGSGRDKGILGGIKNVASKLDTGGGTKLAEIPHDKPASLSDETWARIINRRANAANRRALTKSMTPAERRAMRTSQLTARQAERQRAFEARKAQREARKTELQQGRDERILDQLKRTNERIAAAGGQPRFPAWAQQALARKEGLPMPKETLSINDIMRASSQKSAQPASISGAAQPVEAPQIDPSIYQFSPEESDLGSSTGSWFNPLPPYNSPYPPTTVPVNPAMQYLSGPIQGTQEPMGGGGKSFTDKAAIGGVGPAIFGLNRGGRADGGSTDEEDEENERRGFLEKIFTPEPRGEGSGEGFDYRPAKPDWRDAVTRAGLAMAAGQSPHALSNVATGAMEGMDYYEKQLDLDRKPEVDHSGETILIHYSDHTVDTGIPTMNAKQEERLQRGQDMTAEENQRAENQRVWERQHTAPPDLTTYDDDEAVQSIFKGYDDNGEPIYEEVGRGTRDPYGYRMGAAGGADTQTERMVNRIMKDAEERGQPISYGEAIAIARRGAEDPNDLLRWAHTQAAQSARADQDYFTNSDETLEKWNSYYLGLVQDMLPQSGPGSERPSKPEGFPDARWSDRANAWVVQRNGQWYPVVEE